jgi:HAD superfamily hydrolase (TIGR01509 family)
MTVATETWYTGYHPYTLEPVFSAKSPREKQAQRQYFFWYKPEERRGIEQSLKRIGRQDLIRQLYQSERTMRYRFFPGAEELLHDLHRHGILLALVTSSNCDKMLHVQSQMPAFPQLFDRILTAEDFIASKPHPDCYLRAAEMLGQPPAECIVFEDAFSGLDAGMAAGMFTFGMATTHPRAAIESRCSHVLDSFQGVNYQSLCQILTQTKQ